ncbi:TonB-dependent receptor [Thalassotalea fonticola]|uniref:TonB-dependent receptor n=1 Tax=Thalassotalea fonticola TaxID=3065649 RepID=A0ABZ0GLX6_9GAMM|nr:TonB-dependent receptor [Colwelliaceae bacterium S1-1]
MNSKSQKLFKLSPIFLALGCISVQAGEIETIEVRVQKRTQSVQEVPIAVSAFNGDMMDQLGIADVRDLVDLTPGFNGKTEDSFIDALSIRGIGTNDFGIGGDPSVAIFTDGVWAGRNGGVQMSFYDMERAEVVKGPQGTLFGRNAIAGGINITTNKPISDFEASVGATVAQHGAQEVTGMVNIPLTSSLYFRAAGNIVREDGWLENEAGGGDLGGSEVNSTRLSLRYEGDSTDAILRVTYEDRDQDPSVYWTEKTNAAEDKANIDLLDDQGYDRGEILTVQANIEWQISDEYLLTSITGYKTYDFEYLEDFDAQPSLINNYGQDQEVDYFSQELRLNYQGDGAFTWFLGASVYQEDIDATFSNYYTEDALCIAVIETDDVGGALGCDDPIFEAYWEDDIDPADLLVNKPETNIDKLENSGWSVYGDITWQATAKLDLTFGGRYTTDEKDMSISVLDSGGALGNTFVFEWYTDGFTQADESWSEFTPRVAAVYRLTDTTNLYGNISQGYKSGGYSTFGIQNDGSQEYGGVLAEGSEPLAFDPETSTSYEIGSKMMLADNTVQLNVAYFNYVYEDLQMIIFESGSQLVKNVGEAENQGIEMDMRWTPGDNWDIRVAGAWMDSEITEEIEEGDGTVGNKLPMAPDFSGSIITTYMYPLTDGELSLIAQWVFQDDVYGGPGNYETAKVDAWNELGLRATYASNSDWNVSLYVDNVTDESYFERGWENADADNLNGFGLVNTFVWPSKPRTVGISFDMDF